MKNQTNILLIGCGPHAQRIYVPVLEKDGAENNAQIVAIVDLIEKQKQIDEYIAQNIYHPVDTIYFENTLFNPDKLEILNTIVAKLKINAVIISTEPLAHKFYAQWALVKGLPILMDKPITTAENVSTQPEIAKELLVDYLDLDESFHKGFILNNKIVFSLMAQRRYHPAFQLMKKAIREVYETTNCPITSIQSFHSDGQWRLPVEIINQHYHPYNQGYGKCSHSGYHTIDIVPWLMEAGEGRDKKITEVEVFSNVVRPQDFITQLTPEDHRRILPEYEKYQQYTDGRAFNRMKDFGEIDAFNSIAFKHRNRTVTLASINMVHNGFSQRNWPTAVGRDLYKGNGRVRHESYYIEQGPFQAISYTSYQGKEVDKTKTDSGIYDFGGEYHLDIHIFRNDKMFPQWKNHEVYHCNDLNLNIMTGNSRGHQEDARRNCILEFVSLVNGSLEGEGSSAFKDHWRSTKLLSLIYESMANKYNNINPIVRSNFNERI